MGCALSQLGINCNLKRRFDYVGLKIKNKIKKNPSNKETTPPLSAMHSHIFNTEEI